MTYRCFNFLLFMEKINKCETSRYGLKIRIAGISIRKDGELRGCWGGCDEMYGMVWLVVALLPLFRYNAHREWKTIFFFTKLSCVHSAKQVSALIWPFITAKCNSLFGVFFLFAATAVWGHKASRRYSRLPFYFAHSVYTHLSMGARWEAEVANVAILSFGMPK